MFNIAIIDDDNYFIQKICDLLKKSKYYTYLEIDRFNNVDRVINEKKDFDLLFVDIDLNGYDGIKLVNTYFTNKPVVYITSYKDRMKDAFGRNVYRYVLKEELEDFFNSEFSKLMKELIGSYITIKNTNGISVYKISEILYVEYNNRNITIYTTKEQVVVKRTSLSVFMKPYEDYFIVINRNTYVNYKYIKSISSEDKKVILNNKNETALDVSINRFLDIVVEYSQKASRIWY